MQKMPSFDKFWQHWEGKGDMRALRKDYKDLKYDPTQPMPMEEMYQQMKKRDNTFFIDFNGILYASPALLCKQVQEADTIYWFADFMDAVDVEHLEEVRSKFSSRKQKLFIHASIRGKSFELVKDKLVKPLGGEVIEANLDK